jgi:hypothetical protein
VLPPERVLDLFAVPDEVRSLPGGHGGSVVAGDLVLSPGRDPATAAWLNPPLAWLAADLDTRTPRAVRIAVPVPARDGSWVVDGWGASRYEPDTTAAHDLDLILATGRLFHAELDSAFRARPPLGRRHHRWALAEQAAFATDATRAVVEAVAADDPRRALLQRISRSLTEIQLGADQLVHADIAGNILVDRDGRPVVIDVAPYWRPVLWAEAVSVLDVALWHGAGIDAVATWATDALHREAMRRAGAFRVLSDGVDCDTSRYEVTLAPVLGWP